MSPVFSKRKGTKHAKKSSELSLAFDEDATPSEAGERVAGANYTYIFSASQRDVEDARYYAPPGAPHDGVERKDKGGAGPLAPAQRVASRKRNTSEQDSTGRGGKARDGTGKRTDHVSVDVTVAPKPAKPSDATAKQAKPTRIAEIGSLWGLLVLALAYVHHSTTGFAVPALLPGITADLSLTDSQGAMLTAGYTFLYAIALIPMGLLADRADRPRLLAAGLVGWSLLTVLAAHTHSFGELLATRVGFAIAQATQNPICFSLIPELFPTARTTAMSAYNAAIYLGRAVSFAVAFLAGNLGVMQQEMDSLVKMVPLDKLDLSHVSILYTQGDMAAIVPIYDYRINFAGAASGAAAGVVTNEGWRTWLQWLGLPGLAIAALCLLTVDEPRAERGFLGDPLNSSKFINATTRSFNRSTTDKFSGQQGGAMSQRQAPPSRPRGDSLRQLRKLLGMRSFQAVTAAATLNDVGSWAMVSWHATFYARVYDLPAETYAPLLAVVVPVGGLIGGVGGGLMGDWLSRIGGRQWLTAGASVAAAPFLAASILAPDYHISFAALLVGFALAESWRAPAAIIVRDVSPPGLGSTSASVHLCIRNIIGGCGPLGVAVLAERYDLQHAMLLVPVCFLLSGVTFYVTEQVMKSAVPSKPLPPS